MSSTYQAEMLKLVKTRPFDADQATKIFRESLEINHEIDQMIIDGDGYKTTLLKAAVDYNNLDAVDFLLQHGADPNYISDNYDCPFSDLQFCSDEETPEEIDIRYNIAKLFFEHGADPNLLVEGETVFDQVTYDIYNEPDLLNWEYSIRLYKLLVLYGGGGCIYEKPSFSEPIDFSRVDEYRVYLRKHEDGYHIEGHLLNPNGEDIGVL